MKKPSEGGNSFYRTGTAFLKRTDWQPIHAAALDGEGSYVSTFGAALTRALAPRDSYLAKDKTR